MQLCGPFHQYIRDLRHHIDPHGTAVTVFQQMIPLSGRNIPEHNGTVILDDLLLDPLDPLRNIDAVADLIFFLPGFELGHDVVNRPLPVHDQNLPGRKHSEITGVTYINPHDREDCLHKHGLRDGFHRHHPVGHQRYLEIRKHICKQQREEFRNKHIHGLQIPYLQYPVGAGKEQQQHKIDQQDQHMPLEKEISVSVEVQVRIVFLKPAIPIDSRME